VNDLRDNTFYAIIALSLNNSEVYIDSRPSDAIALALRVNAPIYVSKKVLEEARSIDLTAEKGSEEGESEKLKDWLENLKPEDFGKYEM